MDRFTRTADIIKAYYSYKQTADSATFVKKVCSFFDFIKDESLSDADLNLLLFLANEDKNTVLFFHLRILSNPLSVFSFIGTDKDRIDISIFDYLVFNI